MNESPNGSLFEEYHEGEVYGMFGYQGKCCNLAMHMDSVGMVRECIARGFMDRTTVNLFDESMVTMARKRGKKQVEKYLVSLGWQ